LVVNDGNIKFIRQKRKIEPRNNKDILGRIKSQILKNETVKKKIVNPYIELPMPRVKEWKKL